MTASHEEAAASTTPSAFRRQPCLRRTGYALLATTVLLPMGAVSATAALEPVNAQLGITLFPQRDFLGVEGFQGPVTINVVRDGVIVGTAHGNPLPDAETGTLLEVNHPGGVCWTGVTPDLLPGDRVEVITEDDPNPANQVGAFSNLMNVTAKPAQLLDLNGQGGLDDLVIRGTAAAADGTKLDEGLMEQRIVAPDLKETSVDRRDIRALFTGGLADGVPTTGDIVWDNPTNDFDTNWTATYTDLGADIAAIAAAGQTRVLAWERTDVLDNRIGMTIYEADEIGGPGFGGCPPLASDGVTGTAPANVNLAAQAAGGNFVINGVSTDAASVDLVVDDQDADLTDQVKVTAVPTNAASLEPGAPLPGAQTWRASVPMADVLAPGLAEGDLTVSGTFQRVVETTTSQDTDGDPATAPVPVTSRAAKPLNGAVHSLLKDLVAPVAPTASPAGGQWIGTQSVTVSPEDEIEDTVRYRIGAATVADPTAASPTATGQIVVSSDQTIKARSYDRAGNPSAVVTHAYDIVNDIVPGAPAAPGLTGKDAAIDATWSAPASNGGSPITGYVLRAYQGASTVAVAEVAVGNVLRGTIGNLVNGTDYTVKVSAVNGSGEGAQSAAASVHVEAPARVPFSPTIGNATAISGGANVTWTPPSSDGRSALTGYRVTAYNSATGAQAGAVRTAAATATSLQVTGLVNGTPYDFEVRAVNALGIGDPSERSNTVLVAARSTAPVNVIATAGNASAVVNWSEPTNTGGAEVNSYQVQVRTGTTVVDVVEVFDIEAEVFGLTNGTAYNFRVAAVTTAGVGTFSQPTAAVTPRAPQATVATAPTGVTAARGNASATVSWTAPSNAATSNITGYRVRRYVGTTVTTLPTVAATARSLVVTGLTNGTAYTFDVTAVSGTTFGAVSARTAAVTPAAPTTVTPPAAPGIGTPTTGTAGSPFTATARWSAPTANGGSAVTGYKVYVLNASTGAQMGAIRTAAATATSLNVTVGTSTNIRFQVVATNSAGDSPRSALSASVLAQ